METINIEKIKTEMIDIASKHLSFTLEGDYKGANKMHTKFIKLYNKVKELNKQNDIFEDLVTYNNDGVKLWAATALLNTNPMLAIDCLNKLVQLHTITSMDAKMVLDLWQRGELELL